MLIIGRRKPREGDDFGGVVVLYELFLEYFDNNGIEYEDIDLNWRNYKGKMAFLLVIYFKLSISILSPKHQKVSFHGTTTDFTYYAPLAVFLGMILGKRVTLRKFGGNFDQYFDQLDFFRRGIVTFALKKADVVFFETKYLVNEFSWVNNAAWFPNVRDIRNSRESGHYQQRFVFISQVKETKGINIILKAIRELPDGFVIHLYGPKQDYTPPDGLEKLFEHCYQEVLEPDEVLKTMNKYDVLLLPTFHEGEGYPGTIIEAYSQGLPVISTKWRSIPEIVEDGETGFLIPPKSVAELVGAMQKIDFENYPQLSVNALEFFEKFNQQKIMNRVIKLL